MSFSSSVTTVPSSSIFQFGLSASSNSNPSGILSFISLAYPAISPSLVILTLYSNLTTTEFILLFFRSTFTTSSGSSSAWCPVSVTNVCPFSVTIVLVTHLRNAKSKYRTLTFSISSSSSPFHSFGVESRSSLWIPFLSVCSLIWAWLIKILSDVVGSTTLNAILTSLYSGVSNVVPSGHSKANIKFCLFSVSLSFEQ